jgi:hypothetical protein
MSDENCAEAASAIGLGRGHLVELAIDHRSSARTGRRSGSAKVRYSTGTQRPRPRRDARGAPSSVGRSAMARHRPELVTLALQVVFGDRLKRVLCLVLELVLLAQPSPLGVPVGGSSRGFGLIRRETPCRRDTAPRTTCGLCGLVPHVKAKTKTYRGWTRTKSICSSTPSSQARTWP